MKHWFEDKSVALVGNATSLFDLSYGQDIDSHDVVVRLNKAAMLINNPDAEDTHGKRTGVWIFWSTREYEKHLSEIQNVKKMHASYQARDAKSASLVDCFYPIELLKILKQKAGPSKNPTTGLMAIDYILHSKPSTLSVYGFDWKKTPTHTDPNREADKKCRHNHDVEEEYCRYHVFTRSDAFLKN